jgi:AcrR family transcriptional regulator
LLKKKKKLATARRSRAGRPTREKAARRREEVLDVALEVFLEHGYEGATLEMIIAAAGTTKRTLYSQYEDKTALFKAAVQRAIERYTVETQKVMVVQSDDLEETLTSVARLRIRYVLSPVGQRLQGIIFAEVKRFPDLFNIAYRQATVPLLEYLTGVFRRHAEAGQIDVDDPERVAAVFLNMAVGGPARIMGTNKNISDAEIEERVRFSVRLILRGLLTRKR